MEKPFNNQLSCLPKRSTKHILKKKDLDGRWTPSSKAVDTKNYLYLDITHALVPTTLWLLIKLLMTTG